MWGEDGNDARRIKLYLSVLNEGSFSQEKSKEFHHGDTEDTEFLWLVRV